MLGIRDVYPGSRPNFLHPGSASKNLSILNQKIVSKLLEIWSGLFITDPDPGSGSGFFTHHGSSGQKGTGSRIRIRSTELKMFCCVIRWTQRTGGWSRRRRGPRPRRKRSASSSVRQSSSGIKGTVARVRIRNKMEWLKLSQDAKHCISVFDFLLYLLIFFVYIKLKMKLNFLS